MSNSIFQQLDFSDFAKDCTITDLFDEKKVGSIKVYENDEQPVLFLKEIDAFNKVALEQIAEIHRICWNYQKVLFLYVYTKTEIRIYNCSERPFAYNKQNIQPEVFELKLEELEIYSCKNTDKEKIERLNTIFSRIAIDTGFIWSSVEAIELKKKNKSRKTC